MTRTLTTLATAVAAMMAVPAAAQSSQANGETRLAEALAGRTAGEPVNCIPLSQTRQSRIIDRTAILFDVGNTIYVNRPRSGAEALNHWDTQILRPFGSQICQVDTIRMVDTTSQMLTGVIFLGQFVPYRRASASAN